MGDAAGMLQVRAVTPANTDTGPSCTVTTGAGNSRARFIKAVPGLLPGEAPFARRSASESAGCDDFGAYLAGLKVVVNRINKGTVEQAWH